MDPITRTLMIATGIALTSAAAVTAVWTLAAARTVGRPIHSELSGRRLHIAWVGLLLGIGALVVLTAALPLVPTLLVLGAAAALVALTPSPADSVYGERGVRSGWYARRFEDLEEWRLTGEHLRWRLFGEWVSSRVPPAEHAALRERLERACPQRESRFKR